jgi:multidrug resistance efflux pump
MAGLAAIVLASAGAALWPRFAVDQSFTAVVRRGTLAPRLTVSGTLRPAESLTYRSPLAGREAEIVFLVPEGTRVNEGDLLVRLDTNDLVRELERANQDVRQARVDLQVAELDRQEGQAAIASLSQGEGAITVDEARTRLQLAEKKVERLRGEYAKLQPLLERGFITREELRRTADELEQSEEELALARRRADVLIGQTHPRDRQRAELQLAQKEAQRENVRARLQEVEARARQLREQIENCSMYARQSGLVVYEEYLNANPRRKIRLGDRVTGSQGLVTIPEVSRMLVEASASEADVHRISTGQPALIRLEAFPALRLTGRVTRVGTLARASVDRPFDEKRFDLIIDLDPTEAEVRPEMTARADIQLGERRDVLLAPLNAVFEHDGALVAHVVTRSGIETRQVQIGEASETEIEILGGVHDGERLSLTDAGQRAPTMIRSKGEKIESSNDGPARVPAAGR